MGSVSVLEATKDHQQAMRTIQVYQSCDGVNKIAPSSKTSSTYTIVRMRPTEHGSQHTFVMHFTIMVHIIYFGQELSNIIISASTGQSQRPFVSEMHAMMQCLFSHYKFRGLVRKQQSRLSD